MVTVSLTVVIGLAKLCLLSRSPIRNHTPRDCCRIQETLKRFQVSAGSDDIHPDMHACGDVVQCFERVG